MTKRVVLVEIETDGARCGLCQFLLAGQSRDKCVLYDVWLDGIMVRCCECIDEDRDGDEVMVMRKDIHV